MPERSSRNHTIVVAEDDIAAVGTRCVPLAHAAPVEELRDRVICQDVHDALPHLPDAFVDLLVLDPPYNLTRSFGESRPFRAQEAEVYGFWFESWFVPLLRVLKPDASVYLCSEWRTSGVVEGILRKHLIVRNRITWEREKGRGAKENWKNCHEDIWFATVGERYYFDVDAVKIRRRVMAPYVNGDGTARDWMHTDEGNMRDTHPSNLWTDVTVPFWSMPENTDHPTQKAEKLIAKLVLASSAPGAMVMDPFLGSGTTVVVAKKLGRGYLGIEREASYCAMAFKRLDQATLGGAIQGFRDGVFYARNA